MSGRYTGVSLPPPVLLRREGNMVAVYRVTTELVGCLVVSTNSSGRNTYIGPNGEVYSDARQAAEVMCSSTSHTPSQPSG